MIALLAAVQVRAPTILVAVVAATVAATRRTPQAALVLAALLDGPAVQVA
jgi:hypothetical protein